jgi:hypothetical protein
VVNMHAKELEHIHALFDAEPDFGSMWQRTILCSNHGFLQQIQELIILLSNEKNNKLSSECLETREQLHYLFTILLYYFLKPDQ